jgi:hypothetical protein
LRGELGEGTDSAFKNAEMALNDSGRQEMLLYYGAAKLDENGAYGVAPDTMGLKKIFEIAAPPGAADQGQRMIDWHAWMIGRREQELQKRQGYKPILKPAELADALARGEGRPEYQRAADEWKKFNDANLAFLEQTGRISEAQRKALQAEEFYVPFYRSDQRMDGTSPELDLSALDFKPGVSGRSGLLSRDPGIHKIVGGDKMRIESLMKNMIRNSQAIVAAGMRNNAANKIFELMQEADLASTVPIQASPNKKPSERAVRMWKDGNELWVMPKGAEAGPLMLALAGLQPVQLARILQMGASISSAFRQGITLSIPYILRNGFRGLVAAGMQTTGANMTLANNTWSGVRDALGKGQATQAFKAQSGMGDYRFGESDVGLGKNDILMEFGISKKTLGYKWRQVVAELERWGSASELADRVATYNTLIERGVRPDEAAYQGLNIINYGRRGSAMWLRGMLPLLPFLNSRLQGYLRMTEGALSKSGAPLARGPALKRLAINGALYSVIGTMLWAWNNADDERREKYQAEPLWRRLAFHIVYLGNRTLYIPKPFEFGLFSTLPEVFLDSWANESAEPVPAVLRKIMADTIGFNLIPAAVKPIIEGTANYDYFTQRPIEGMRESRLRPRDRISGAGPLATFIGQQLGISDLTKLSPAMIEHYLNGYGGSYYTFLSAFTGAAGGDLGITPRQSGGAFGNVPVLSPVLSQTLGSFLKYGPEQTSRFVDEVYQTGEHVTQIWTSARDARRQGDMDYLQQLMAEAPATPAAYKLLNKAQSEIGKINTQVRAIRLDRTMSPAEKQRRNEVLQRARNGIARDVMQVIRQMEAQQGRTFAAAS